MKAVEVTRINPNGILPEPLPIMEAAAAVAKLDGYTENETDHSDMERQWPQLKGQFLIDRDGIVRWANIECATEGLAGVGNFPPVMKSSLRHGLCWAADRHRRTRLTTATIASVAERLLLSWCCRKEWELCQLAPLWQGHRRLRYGGT
jgi:hypothetical protein